MSLLILHRSLLRGMVIILFAFLIASCATPKTYIPVPYPHDLNPRLLRMGTDTLYQYRIVNGTAEQLAVIYDELRLVVQNGDTMLHRVRCRIKNGVIADIDTIVDRFATLRPVRSRSVDSSSDYLATFDGSRMTVTSITEQGREVFDTVFHEPGYNGRTFDLLIRSSPFGVETPSTPAFQMQAPLMFPSRHSHVLVLAVGGETEQVMGADGRLYDAWRVGSSWEREFWIDQKDRRLLKETYQSNAGDSIVITVMRDYTPE